MQSGYCVPRAPIRCKSDKAPGRGLMLFPKELFASIIREAFESYDRGRSLLYTNSGIPPWANSTFHASERADNRRVGKTANNQRPPSKIN
ncbi:MAG: hypothetical protein AAF871_15020 [Pseudomonadota bacterium]